MNKIRVSDVTMKQKKAQDLSFREKLETVKLLDRLHVDVIELAALSGNKADSLLVKSIAQSVKNASVAVPVSPSKEEADRAWESLKEAAKPRLQIVCPTSSVQMEYLYHIKPQALCEKVVEVIRYCKGFCKDVEFVAEDATRSEESFLCQILDGAISAGAEMVCICDEAGQMMPAEYGDFLKRVIEKTEGLKKGAAEFGVLCSDALYMADILSVTGALFGAKEIKASCCPEGMASLKNIAKIFTVKGDLYGLQTGVSTVELGRIAETISGFFHGSKKKLPVQKETGEKEERTFTVHDGIDVIIAETKRLGFDLSEEDNKIVFDTFVRTASKKEKVSSREVEAIIASSALQVPPVYTVEDYIINTGTLISATCHMKLRKDGKLLESVAIGDGPVDASFLAIEQITGHHYELDDFQIQSVTEGRTAMGETIIKLRAGGKLYSGRGISTDVLGSSIHAYVNALNKIVYEEENA